MFLAHLITQLLKYFVKQKFKFFYVNYVKSLLGLPKISFSFVKSFIITSMMLTCNLELYFDNFYFYLFKINLMAIWFTLIITYPIFYRKK
jgi:hypothetical protein